VYVEIGSPKICAVCGAGVGEKRKLAVEEPGLGEGDLIHAPAETVGVQVGFEEARHLGFGHRAGETAVGVAVGGAAAAGGLAVRTQILHRRICRSAVRSELLGIEFGNHLLGHGLELIDAGAASFGLLGRAQGIMGDDQAVAGEAALGQPGLVEGEVAEGLDQFRIAPGGHGKDELEFAASLISQRREFTDILEAQEPAVGHQDDAQDGAGRAILLHITDAGLAAIGIEPEAADTANTGATEAPVEPAPKKGCGRTKAALTGADDAAPRKSREGTKQAIMITMLRRPEGATIAQISEATGWQFHTVRGAFAGALKKKLGLEVTSQKVEGSERIYRLPQV